MKVNGVLAQYCKWKPITAESFLNNSQPESYSCELQTTG